MHLAVAPSPPPSSLPALPSPVRGRYTAVMRLARAGCTLPEIVAITGHSARGAAAILERHYLSADQRVSESAIAKLEQDRNANR